MRPLAPLLFSLLICLLAPSSQATAKSPFPLYFAIQDNVRFWEQIYGTYTSTQGVLHDKDNLSIIYDDVDLVPWGTPGAAKINSEIIKLARQRYKDILADLGEGKAARSADAKRVAAMFKEKGHIQFKKARENIRLQLGMQDRFLEGVIRSGRYMKSIRTIFTSQGLPSDLSYLPHVESSFNPLARSKAGAIGLWQFTTGTGLQYLTINDLIDERYDPLLSTHAAAKLLKENHAQLETWPFALTAYNYGRAGMVRAVRQYKTYTDIFNQHETALFKFASRNFYSEFLAALHVAKRIEKDPKIMLDRPEATVTIRLAGFASMAALCRHFSVSTEDFSRLNPALLKPVLTGDKHVPKGYLLRLPATAAVRRGATTLGSKLFHTDQLPDTLHVVKPGETAGSIARKYKVSLADLKQTNKLDPKATIRAGQKLLIPGQKKGIIILKKQGKQSPAP